MNDRDALVSFFQGTIGKKWSNKENWNSELRVGRWLGVGMDISGHVASISLPDNQMEGILMDSDMWQYLSYLKVLYLMKNFLKSSIPQKLYHLKSLEELNLSWNEMEGDVPEALYSLTDLKLIRLDSNRFCGEISPLLRQLTKLKHINLSRNNFTGEVPKVGHFLPALQVLDFTRNQFDGWIPATAREFVEYNGDEDKSKDQVEDVR